MFTFGMLADRPNEVLGGDDRGIEHWAVVAPLLVLSWRVCVCMFVLVDRPSPPGIVSHNPFLRRVLVLVDRPSPPGIVCHNPLL